MAIAPEVLLMDESCSAMDRTSTHRIEETIADLRHETTIVIVSTTWFDDPMDERTLDYVNGRFG